MTQKTRRPIPENALSSMHPKTRELLQKILHVQGPTLSWKSQNAHQARIRLKALRRAKARGYIFFEDAIRKGATVMLRMR